MLQPSIPFWELFVARWLGRWSETQYLPSLHTRQVAPEECVSDRSLQRCQVHGDSDRRRAKEKQQIEILTSQMIGFKARFIPMSVMLTDQHQAKGDSCNFCTLSQGTSWTNASWVLREDSFVPKPGRTSQDIFPVSDFRERIRWSRRAKKLCKGRHSCSDTPVAAVPR